MKGDSLKIEQDTPEKPEVIAISTRLNLDAELVFAKCFKVWRWADRHAPGGRATNAAPAILDSLVHTPGFSDALCAVGWLRVRNGTLEFPNYERHFGHSRRERQRATERKRQQRKRDAVRHADVTVTCHDSHSDMSRYERDTPSPPLKEKEKSPPIPPPKEREKNPPTPSARGLFVDFWKAYPRKTAKQAATKAWERLKPSPELLRAMLAALERQKASEQWQKGIVPHPATWLNGRRWEDETVGGNGRPSASPETPEERAARLDRLAREREESRRATAPPEQVREMLDKMRRPPDAGRP